MGSITIAAWIALGGFWLLLIYGWFWNELSPTGIGVFVGLWLAARVGLPYLNADGFFITWVAILDIALVFIIFKGDVPIT
jgi:hypothetical protein